MTDRLVILCTSERPDPYFNAIAHAKLNLGVSEVLFVGVAEAMEANGGEKAARVVEAVRKLVGHLGRGEYWKPATEQEAEVLEQVEEPASFVEFMQRLEWDSLRLEQGRYERGWAEGAAEL